MKLLTPNQREIIKKLQQEGKGEQKKFWYQLKQLDNDLFLPNSSAPQYNFKWSMFNPSSMCNYLRNMTPDCKKKAQFFGKPMCIFQSISSLKMEKMFITPR
jgi:hypothetical protein